jgi:lysozyme
MNTREYLISLNPAQLKELAQMHIAWCKQNGRVSGEPVIDLSDPANIYPLGFRENLEHEVNNGLWNDWLVVFNAEGSQIIRATVDPGVNKHMLGHLRQGYYDSYLVRPHNWASRVFPKAGKIPRWAICQDRGKVEFLRTDGDGKVIVASTWGNFGCNIHDKIGKDPSLACTVVYSDDDYINQYLPYLYDVKGKRYPAANYKKMSYGMINHDRMQEYIGQSLGKEISPTGITYHHAQKAIREDYLRTTQEGINLIKGFEGLKLTAYRDVAGIWTIGYGTTIYNGKPVTQGMTITQAQAEEAFMKDVDKFENGIEQMIQVPVKPNQFDALVSLTYNIGREGLRQSTVLRELNAGNYEKAADAFLLWNKATVNGVRQVIEGLKNRRIKEREYFLV